MAIILTVSMFPIPAHAAATVDVVNVKDLGAVGDGVTDDTNAFQNAITQSASTKKPVYVPYGIYKISQALTLTNQLMFGVPEGSWSSDSATLPTIKQSSTTANAIILNAGGAVSGLNFDYTQNESGTPTQYAATILLNGVGTRVSNVRIFHAWTGIDCSTENTGRAVLEDIFISYVAKMGIRLTGGWDVSTLDNIEVWTPSTTYNGYFGNNGVGIKLEFNDGLRMSNVFVYGAQTGILFQQTGVNGVWGNLLNVSTDFCSIGMKIAGTHHLTMAGGSLWSHYSGLEIDGEYTELNITGTDIRSNGAAAVQVTHAYAVNMSAVNITRTYASYEAPAINAQGAYYLLINGNHLNAMAQGIVIGSGVHRSVITSNIINVTDGTGVGIVQQSPPNAPVIANNIVI